MITWTPKLIRAKNFARSGHDSVGQIRKYTGEKYWTHTEEVAEIVSEVIDNEDVIIGALYHDLAEDVNKHPYTLDNILSVFGEDVFFIVRDLTDKYTHEAYPNLNRAERKTLEAWRLGFISPDAQTVKVADLLSNTKSIVESDPGFAVTYLKEKEVVLSKLTKAHPVLLERAKKQLTKAKTKLNMI